MSKSEVTHSLSGTSTHPIMVPQCHCHAWAIHIPTKPSQSALPLLRYGYFKHWPWKLKVKVMFVVKVHSHVVSPASNWVTSFCFTSTRSTIPEIYLFLNLILKNPKTRPWVRPKVKVTYNTQYPTDARPFCVIPDISPIEYLTLKTYPPPPPNIWLWIPPPPPPPPPPPTHTHTHTQSFQQNCSKWLGEIPTNRCGDWINGVYLIAQTSTFFAINATAVT